MFRRPREISAADRNFKRHLRPPVETLYWYFRMKLNSYTITQGRDRAPARSMLKAIGFTDEDLKKPIIGVANTWIETMPCNYNLHELAKHVKQGIREAGGTPM